MEYRGYKVESLGTFPMVNIKAKGSGKIPKTLVGSYTTTAEATKAIDCYLSSLLKGKQNGKTKGVSTG